MTRPAHWVTPPPCALCGGEIDMRAGWPTWIADLGLCCRAHGYPWQQVTSAWATATGHDYTHVLQTFLTVSNPVAISRLAEIAIRLADEVTEALDARAALQAKLDAANEHSTIKRRVAQSPKD